MSLKLFDETLLGASRPMARAAKPGETWYRIAAAEGDSDEVDVLIYSEIGWWGVTAEAFVRELQEITAKIINVRLNSPGGSVFDGIAIYNGLVRHSARVVIHIDGWAASIASVIAMAGDEIRIAETGYVMIHKPWSWAIGDAETMRREADVLDKLEDGIVDIYVARTDGKRKEIVDWVADETWFKGQEAIDAGFADVLVDTKKKPADPAARLDADFFATIFPHLPDDVRTALGRGASKPGAPDRIRTRQDLRRVLTAHGMSRGAADAVATHFRPAGDARDEPPAGDPPTPDPRIEAVIRASQASLIHSAAATFPRI